MHHFFLDIVCQICYITHWKRGKIMPSTTPEQMDYSLDQMVEFFSWRFFTEGFVGESCGMCKATANVMGGGAGWVCPCGHYNNQCWHGGPMAHSVPDYGPPAKRIRWAAKRHRFEGMGFAEKAETVVTTVTD